jgi:DNA repair ATPase RecN
MIQSVVEASVFQIGTQYFSEGRVRITDADDHQIASLVFGIQGIHEQTLRLGDGYLTSKCSCSSSEQPLCRHATASLLEYFRRAAPKPQARMQERDVHDVEVREVREALAQPPQAKKTSGLDIRLSEITSFVEWLQEGVQALENGGELPAAPQLGGEAMEWVKALQRMEERRRASQEKQSALEADLQHRDVQLVRLTQQLQASMQEAKDAQSACQNLEREVAGFRMKFVTVLDQVKEFDRQHDQMKSLAEDLARNAANMDHLADAFKKFSASVQGLHPTPVHGNGA